MKALFSLALLFATIIASAEDCDRTLPNRCEIYAEVSTTTMGIAQDTENAIRRWQLRDKTIAALDAIFRLAEYKLKKEGHKFYAWRLIKEWEYHKINLRDLGDHAPLSAWIDEKYHEIADFLGPQVTHFLRIDDLEVINHAVPVVFSCIDNVWIDEYERHFTPLCGTITYWTAFFSCVGFTWGTGFYFCSPIAMGSEFLVEKFVAPKLNEWAWEKACGAIKIDRGQIWVY